MAQKEGNKIAAGKNEPDVTLKCDDKAKIATYDLTVTGSFVASDDDGNSETALKLSATADWKGFKDLKLAVAIPTPFKLFGTFDTNYAHRGSTFEKTLYITLELLANFFQIFLVILIFVSLAISIILLLGSFYRIVKVLRRKTKFISYN